MLAAAFVLLFLLVGGFTVLVGLAPGDRLLALAGLIVGAPLLTLIVLHLRRPVRNRPPPPGLRADLRELGGLVRRRRTEKDDDAPDG